MVNTTPGEGALEFLTAQPTGWLDGRILIDASNRDGDAGDAVENGESVAERLQRAPRRLRREGPEHPEPHRPGRAGLLRERTTLFFSGESAAAKSIVAALLTDLGWQPADILDLGGIRTAHATEHFIRMYYAQRDGLGTRDFNVRVVIRRDEGSGAAG